MSYAISVTSAVRELKKTDHYEATVARYGVHLRLCRALGVEPEPFAVFAQDVVNAPEESRDEMLNPAPPPPYESVRRYRQYGMPTKAEMFGGTPPNKSSARKKKRKKRAIQR